VSHTAVHSCPVMLEAHCHNNEAVLRLHHRNMVYIDCCQQQQLRGHIAELQQRSSSMAWAPNNQLRCRCF
jgi:hypothetical protein